MDSSTSYGIRLTDAAAKRLRKLDRRDRERISESLRRLARQTAGSSGFRGGKSLKRIRGRRDHFYRLRVGELRIMFDLRKDDRVLLVLGIVDRRDLERWLRGR